MSHAQDGTSYSAEMPFSCAHEPQPADILVCENVVKFLNLTSLCCISQTLRAKAKGERAARRAARESLLSAKSGEG